MVEMNAKIFGKNVWKIMVSFGVRLYKMHRDERLEYYHVEVLLGKIYKVSYDRGSEKGLFSKVCQ